MNLKNLAYSELGAQISDCSSYSNKILAKPSNVLTDDRKEVWTSGQGLPQYITINLSRVKTPYTFIRTVGFDCWHSYQTNPRIIEVFVKESEQDEHFDHWTTLKAQLKSGKQLFDIPELPKDFGIIKFQIKETFGEFRTYLNQVFLFGQEQQIFEGDNTSRQPNLFDNELEMRKTDRIQVFGSHRNRSTEGYDKSPSLENGNDLLQVTRTIEDIEQGMRQLTRRVDKLDLKVSISHEGLEKRIMERVEKLIDQKGRIKKDAERQALPATKDKIIELTLELEQKLRLREKKILELSRRRQGRRQQF